jgi:hypothetical protein
MLEDIDMDSLKPHVDYNRAISKEYSNHYARSSKRGDINAPELVDIDYLVSLTNSLDVDKKLKLAINEFVSDVSTDDLKQRIGNFSRFLHSYHSDIKSRLNYAPNSLKNNSYEFGLSDDSIVLLGIENYIENCEEFNDYQKQIMYAVIEDRPINYRAFTKTDYFKSTAELFAGIKKQSKVTEISQLDVEKWQTWIYDASEACLKKEAEWQEMIHDTLSVVGEKEIEKETGKVTQGFNDELEQTLKFPVGVIPIEDCIRTVVVDNRVIESDCSKNDGPLAARV